VRVQSCFTRGTRVVPVDYLPSTVSFCAARENILPSHKMYDKKVKISLLQAMEAHRIARG
jgi:hypothetical protein